MFFHKFVLLVAFAILHVGLQFVVQLIINMVYFDLETSYGFSKSNMYDMSDCICCLVYKNGGKKPL